MSHIAYESLYCSHFLFGEGERKWINYVCSDGSCLANSPYIGAYQSA